MPSLQICQDLWFQGIKWFDPHIAYPQSFHLTVRMRNKCLYVRVLKWLLFNLIFGLAFVLYYFVVILFGSVFFQEPYYFRPELVRCRRLWQLSLLGPEWQFLHLKSNWAQSWWWKQMWPKTSPPDWAVWESVSEYHVKKLQLGFSSQSRLQRRAEGTCDKESKIIIRLL